MKAIFASPVFLADNRSKMAVKLSKSQNVNLSFPCCKNERLFAKSMRIRKYFHKIQQVRDTPEKEAFPRFFHERGERLLL